MRGFNLKEIPRTSRPGQYEDAETGLYYNRFRYYDPESGQYASQDPIGLAGGLGPHAYVHDPLSWVDPWGLSETCGPRRTKHVDNRHVSRRKYPDKSKYRKPNQIDKLNARTIADADVTIIQGKGRLVMLQVVAAAELEQAVAAAIEAGRPTLGAVRQLLDKQRADLGKQPAIVPRFATTKASQVVVKNHALDTYDRLRKDDP